jgi:hypothetical protein
MHVYTKLPFKIMLKREGSRLKTLSTFLCIHGSETNIRYMAEGTDRWYRKEKEGNSK